MSMRTRLTLPMRFNTETRALGAIRDNQLFNIGAQHVALDDTGRNWRVVIDTGKPDAVARYLAQHMPGVNWHRAELPA
jgi:hypothetical protein